VKLKSHTGRMTADMQRAADKYDVAIEKAATINAKIQKLPDTATASQRDPLASAFASTMHEADREFDAFKEAEARRDAGSRIAGLRIAGGDVGDYEASDTRISVIREESQYRPDRPESFIRDLYDAQKGNPDARERLYRNREQALDYHAGSSVEKRDMINSAGAGGEFVPPLYLADLWVEPSISRKPLADALPSLPLPSYGTSISIPQLASGVTVAARSDGGTVSETDGVTASITHDVNEIAGQVDVGRIAVMRSDPTLDMVIGQTLMRRHDAYLDSQLINGSGTAPQHRGLLNQAAGSQAGGFVDGLMGLRVVIDANMPTALGAGTNEDRVIVLASEDVYLMQGPVYARVFEDVGSGEGKIRYQVFSHSAYLSKRYPDSISVISGTGLSTPSF
jgi:HK97 family phage major capsid protein